MRRRSRSAAFFPGRPGWLTRWFGRGTWRCSSATPVTRWWRFWPFLWAGWPWATSGWALAPTGSAGRWHYTAGWKSGSGHAGWHFHSFYTPPASELKAALERLIPTDPLNERNCQLQLAELAWDLGDDPACIRLSQSAFAPASPGAPPFVFDPKFRVPPDALARLIAALLQTEKVEAAWAICERARQSGYSDPLLEMTCQKVAAARNRPGISTLPGE